MFALLENQLNGGRVNDCARFIPRPLTVGLVIASQVLVNILAQHGFVLLQEIGDCGFFLRNQLFLAGGARGNEEVIESLCRK
jgi:hypothetical protein